MQNLTQSERAQSWLSDKDKRANIYFMSAKYDVDDEFYTSFDEIRAEIQDYRTHFKGKVVVCPCNDGKKSNFYRYFALNFKSLELKKLITTTYNIKEPKSKGMKNKKGKIWLGNHQVNIFTRPDGSKKRFSNISWFTNLKSIKHQNGIRLTQKYKGNENKYPEYDNYKIIEVKNCKDIPIDYDGVIGIPLTFFLRHNPAQFKILGCDFEIKDKYPELVKHTYKENNTKSAVLKGQELFTRIIIQRKGGLKPRARILNQF